jgi:hypothetical protein
MLNSAACFGYPNKAGRRKSSIRALSLEKERAAVKGSGPDPRK